MASSPATEIPANDVTPTPSPPRQHHVSTTMLYGVPIVYLVIDEKERLCLAQISNTLLKKYSYNEIHNRRVALGITCVQCTPVQLEILRRAGAMAISSRRCGMITKREAERLVKSFLDDPCPPKLPENFAFDVKHECGWGSRGSFIPSRYNSSRAKCIKCTFCNMYFSPNKFIFHFHRAPESKYHHPDAANFNSWRRHLHLTDEEPGDDLVHAWEDVKAMFNGGTRKRIFTSAIAKTTSSTTASHDHQPKRPKFDPAPDMHGVLPQQPPLPYPLFPMSRKLITEPMKPLRHPVFSMPSPNKPESATDTIYPPYEMIWAKHLGLSNSESNLVPNATSRPPFVKPPAAIPVSFPLSISPGNSQPCSNYSAKSLIERLDSPKINMHSEVRVSAFTPVISGRPRSESESESHQEGSESESENVDVVDIEEQCEQNNNESKTQSETPSSPVNMINNETAQASSVNENENETESETNSSEKCEINPDPSSPPKAELRSPPPTNDGVYRDFSALTKGQLQEELLIEIQVRKKIEDDCKHIRGTFQEQVEREKQYRDEVTRQLHIVRGSLCQELDLERKARFTLQQKLKGEDSERNYMIGKSEKGGLDIGIMKHYGYSIQVHIITPPWCHVMDIRYSKTKRGA
uniref:c-SKI SMAD4-binding domain-containing protein n=1 Tax=Capitella teleta TaxID=283909 RepID=X2ARP5_CAPTE